MDRPTETGTDHPELLVATNPDIPVEDSDDSRRAFLKTGLKGVALLPYVAPLIETITLSEAQAQGSPTGNDPPPPPLPAPVVSGCNPSEGFTDEALLVTVVGSEFQNGATVNFGSGIIVQNVTYISSTTLNVNIQIQSSASPGTRNVTVTNPDTQSGTKLSAFEVKVAPPLMVFGCNPSVGFTSENLWVTVNGQSFKIGATADFGSGITILNVTYISSTNLSVNIQILGSASPYKRDVTITNPDLESATAQEAFEVKQAEPLEVGGCSPGDGFPNTTVCVTVNGKSFQNGATVDFGSGIIVQNVTYISSTDLNVNIHIQSSASLGKRDVTVTNPDLESATKQEAFEVKSP